MQYLPIDTFFVIIKNIMTCRWWNMSNSKDKRIKKLKKVSVWPSILGLFVITFIFAVILVGQVFANTLDIIRKKVMEPVSQAKTIAAMFEGYDEEHKHNIEASVLNYAEIMPDIEAVWVADVKGDKVWSNNDIEPNVDEAGEIPISEKESITLIFEDDLAKGIKLENNTFIISDELIEEFDLEDVFTSVFEFENEKELVQIKVWYLQEAGQFKVYVLQNISLFANDFFTLITSTLLFGVMIAVFILYYLLSFISVIVNTRKTTKVIYTDMVTGGNNWLYFVKRGNKVLKKKSASSEYAVIHLKMRKYRSFCTCFGVKEGEVLIEKLYYALKKNIKRSEVMAYKENASFGLLLSYTDDVQLTERIEALTTALDAVLPSMKLYFAVGVYKVQKKERDIEQLYNNALLACDMLGEEAENKIVFFDVEMNKRRLWERKVEDDMDAALVRHEFQVYLQPKISTAQETLAGAEALVRWIHPQEGFIPPNKFIPIFERNGFILKLDDYMLEEIARQQAQWIREGRKVVPISVNISRAHFAKEDLAEHICSIVDKYQVPHNVIELELTESAFFDDKEILLQTVKKLREAGFPVSMDDFGAGYSSLNSLKELQLDVLKLDADFFRGVDAQERGMLIVSEVIDLAKKLNMKIVAEGIESREQVDFLTEQECDLIQGYFFAKPMPIAEFEEKYKEM